MLSDRLRPYRYVWPSEDLRDDPAWSPGPSGDFLTRQLPEDASAVAADSRWPGFFPSPICLVTTGDGETTALEKVVGPSIVNRFPYVVALSFCREDVSPRHYARRRFCELLERTGVAAVQFLLPGAQIDAAMGAVATVPDEATDARIARSGLPTRPAMTNGAPVFSAAVMVYEASLVRPMIDHMGVTVYEQPWRDVGSHRVYFLEINAIQLREEIADGRQQIRWRSLPRFTPRMPTPVRPAAAATPGAPPRATGYQKGYTPRYSFPSAGTIAFAADDRRDGMAVKYLSREDPLELDNDRARWPCFFPQSAGLITTQHAGRVNVMPCGSTTLVSRSPLVISPCVSYAEINERYAPRASLDLIRASGRFGVGVPYIDDKVIEAIKYAGNTSLEHDVDKLLNSGLVVDSSGDVPYLPDLPVHFDCKVIDEVRLGTHIMYFGEVERIRVRADVTPDNPLEWCPWPDVQDADVPWPTEAEAAVAV